MFNPSHNPSQLVPTRPETIFDCQNEELFAAKGRKERKQSF